MKNMAKRMQGLPYLGTWPALGIWPALGTFSHYGKNGKKNARFAIVGYLVADGG